MYAKVVLKVQKRPQALAIPIEAVSSDKNPTVYLINSQDKMEERPVVLGMETPTRYEVKSGLKEGDVILVGRRGEIKPGEKVEPKHINS
jgi:membrane fusion protein (multidrug efflux system)